jgi:hypothetical protein
MRTRQSSMVLYVLSCDRADELTWHVLKPPKLEDDLWFPVERQFTSSAAGGGAGECLITVGKQGGYSLHARFRGLLHWLRDQGISYYLTAGTLHLVLYWHPGTSVSSTSDNTLYKNYMHRLSQGAADGDLKRLQEHRAQIKRAMDAGQTTAAVQVLYKGPQGFYEKSHETIAEICTICHETRQILTNSMLDDELQWVVNLRYKPLIDMLDAEGLRWSLRFEDVNRYEWAVMIACW